MTSPMDFDPKILPNPPLTLDKIIMYDNIEMKTETKTTKYIKKLNPYT